MGIGQVTDIFLFLHVKSPWRLDSYISNCGIKGTGVRIQGAINHAADAVTVFAACPQAQ